MKAFIEHPVPTLMLFLALLILGIYSLLHIPLELSPKEEYPRISVDTQWPGASPEQVQVYLTSPLEELCSSVKGVRKIESSSSIGNSSITIEFNEKTDMNIASIELRERVASFVDQLPPGAFPPQIRPYIPKEFQTKPFLSLTLSSDLPLNKLREIADKKVKEEIRSVKGVSEVRVTGGAEPEIKIILDRDKINYYGISPASVLSSIITLNRSYPIGKIKKGEKELIFRVPSPISKVEDIGETICGFYGKIPLRLKEIAKIEMGYGEVLSMRRINGESTVGIDILKEPGISTMKVSSSVKKVIESLKKTLPSNITLRIIDDESKEIKKRLKNLIIMMALITGIVFVLLYIFLDSLIPSIAILSSIFFSACITINFVYFSKFSLNLLTLSGLVLGFGMLVDNSVVVFENIWKRYEIGEMGEESVWRATKEVALPAFASTLTTVIVFMSFPFFQGRLRIYYLPLAFVIAFSLLSSYFVAFTLIPSLSSRIIKEKRIERKYRFGFYKKMVGFFIKYPLIIILLLSVLFYFSYKIFRKEVSFGAFFSWYYKERLVVMISTPPGTPIERTDEIIKEFEERALSKDYPKEVNTYVYPEEAYMIITFPKNIELSPAPYMLKEELINLATNFAGIGVGVYGFDPQGYYSSPYVGSWLPYRIKFLGYNFNKLKEITSNVEKTLLKNPRIKEVKTVSSKWYWGGQDYYEFDVKIDREKLGIYGVTVEEILPHIYSNIKGRVTRAYLRIEGREWPLSLKIKGAEDTEIEKLKEVLVKTTKGEFIRLGDIISISETPIPGSIDREDQQFQRTVMWDYLGPYKAGERYKDALYKSLILPPGYSAKVDEPWRLTTEEERKLGLALFISLTLIFMILCAVYEDFVQPLVVMLSVPLALIGVFIAFIISKYPFDSSAYIGVILMSGVVVNNAILMVNHINLKRKEGMGIFDAIKEGAGERLRPILITSTTTIFGMLPFVLIQTERGRDIWSTLALSSVGGLTSSTIFILIATPVFYLIGERFKVWILKVLRGGF
jgi:HAE1 family hydrophobic/amphiphilic exporter-1